MSPHPPLHLVHLGRRLAVPPGGQWQVALEDPARSVMTDFNERGMVTVPPELQVDAALEVMKHAGVRSAFAVDEERGKILGLVNAYDIMGEKPLRHLQDIGGNHLTSSRDDVRVEDIMERAEDWMVARLEDVDAVTVGAILDVFGRTGRTHVAVVEDAEGAEPRLRGILSAAKILRLTEDCRRPASGASAEGASAHG